MRLLLAYRPVKLISARQAVTVCQFAYHRIDKFYTVIFGGVVACRNHDTNRSIALLGTEARDHSDSEHDMIEAICTIVWLVS
jgi:hypothetical protein